MKHVCTWLVMLALWAGSAAAQTAASDPVAKQHYDNAMAAYGLARYAEAAAEFEKAYERKPQPALLFNAAQAHREAGNRERALVLYRNYLHVYGAQAANGADVRRIIEQLEAAPPAASPVDTTNPASGAATVTPAPAPIAAGNGVVATAPPRRKPIYERGWFWGAVAGGAVVVGGVIALGVVFGTSTKNPTPTIATWAY